MWAAGIGLGMQPSQQRFLWAQQCMAHIRYPRAVHLASSSITSAPCQQSMLTPSLAATAPCGPSLNPTDETLKGVWCNSNTCPSIPPGLMLVNARLDMPSSQKQHHALTRAPYGPSSLLPCMKSHSACQRSCHLWTTHTLCQFGTDEACDKLSMMTLGGHPSSATSI